MNLPFLETFIEVAKRGSMTEAAAALKMSPSAVSQQISKLEQDMETRLLERNPFGVTTTPAGAELLERAKHLVGVASDIKEAVRDAAEISNRRLRIASFTSAHPFVLAPSFSLFREKFPNVAVSLIETHYDDPFSALLVGEIDITLAFQYDNILIDFPKGVVVEEIGREPLHVLMPKNHHLAERTSVSFEDLQHEHWVYFPPGNIIRKSIEKEAARHDFMPEASIQTRDYMTAFLLVDAGLGISLLPALMIEEFSHLNVTTRKLTESDFSRTIFVAYREGTTSEAVLAMKDEFKTRYIARLNNFFKD